MAIMGETYKVLKNQLSTLPDGKEVCFDNVGVYFPLSDVRAVEEHPDSRYLYTRVTTKRGQRHTLIGNVEVWRTMLGDRRPVEDFNI